ncbi:MAG: hypothetical protein Fur0021_23860 [Candidatus Promineifilaceae bacterium]
MHTLNLDQKAAQYAQNIVNHGGSDIENPVTKALGVLQEQGVYASVLYLLANKHRQILSPLYDLLRELPAFQSSPDLPQDAKDILKFYSDNVCNNLDTLLLVKDLYEQTLIYARYGAKAAGK